MNWLMFIRPWHDCHKNTETSQTLKGLKILALYDMYKHLYYIIHVWLWHDIIELKTQKHLTQQKYISSDRAQECFKLRYMTVIVTAMLNVSKISITIATQLHITGFILQFSTITIHKDHNVCSFCSLSACLVSIQHTIFTLFVFNLSIQVKKKNKVKNKITFL
jgi:hypothetical protein